MVGADTVQRPGGDAAVVRVHGSRQGPGDHHRLHPALLLRRSGRGRQAGHCRGVAQPVGGGCHAAGRDQLPQLRQSPSAPRSWARSSAASRAWSEACRALDFPIVLGQRLALQRKRKATTVAARRSCRPRRSAAIGLLEDWYSKSATIAFKGTGDIILAGRRAFGPSRPVALAARAARPRGGPAPGGRPR